MKGNLGIKGEATPHGKTNDSLRASRAKGLLSWVLPALVVLGLVLVGIGATSNGPVSARVSSGDSGSATQTPAPSFQQGVIKTVELVAGQNMNAGTVTVSISGGNLVVTFNTTGEWKMYATHLYVGTEKPTDSAPGQFPYQHDWLKGVTQDTYTIPLSWFDAQCGTTLYIAAHADLGSQTGWGQGTGFGHGWAMYFSVTIPCVTPTPTATATNTPQPTATNTLEPTETNTPEPTATNTLEPTETNTPEPTATNTLEPTATNTPLPTATNTPEPTETHTPEPTETNTPEPTATATNVPQPTETATNVPQPTATATNIPQPTATATNIPQPTETATNVPQPTATATNIPQPTETATNVPQPTATRIPPTQIAPFIPLTGITETPTATPVTPAPTATQEPTLSPTVPPTFAPPAATAQVLIPVTGADLSAQQTSTQRTTNWVALGGFLAGLGLVLTALFRRH